MSAPNDGGAAFPVVLGLSDPAGGWRQIDSTEGLSLRDYFAAKVLSGCYVDCSLRWRENEGFFDGGADFVRHVVTDAYGIADAMLAERERAK